MIIESYLVACISCLIAFYNASFASASEGFQSVLAILIFLMLLTMPAILIFLVKKHWKNDDYLKTPDKTRFVALFEGLDVTKGPVILVYLIFFMLRRLILALIVVTMKDVLAIQICLQTFSVMIAVALISYADVYPDSSQRRLEIINEVVIMLALYCTICFSPMIDDVSTKFKFGYVSCIIVCSHLLANLFFILRKTIMLFIIKVRVLFAKRGKKKMRSKSLRSRAKGNVMRRRRKRRHAKRRQIFDYCVEVDEEIE